MLALVAALLFAQTTASAGAPDRGTEGDWYVGDTTDNNTGVRKVDALNTHVEDSEFVMVSMICRAGSPRVIIQWENATFADQAVFTIQPSRSPNDSGAGIDYVFQKITAEDHTKGGMEASREVSAQIIAGLGSTPKATIVAHLPYMNRSILLNVQGTSQAWARVARHCPEKTGPLPPL